MLTNDQKAGAWDGLKAAVTNMTVSTEVSADCFLMARQFLLLMNQVEEKVESGNRTMQPRT